LDNDDGGDQTEAGPEEEEEETSSQDLQTAATTRTHHHPTSTRADNNPHRHSHHRPPRDYHHLKIKSTPTLKLLADPELSLTVRDIGITANWSLSTAKPGNGVDQLRDSSLDTYWQSDGIQPHHINIQFPRRQTISAIALYLDFTLDESYTPKKMKIRVGTTFHNLEEIRTVDVREPCGWVTIPLWRKWGEDVFDNILDPHGDDNDDDEEGGGGETTNDGTEDGGGRRKNNKSSNRVPLWKRKPMRSHMVQISILSMHQNGRDTHVRQVKIFGPRDYGGGNGIGTMGHHHPSHHGLHHRGVGGKRSDETTIMMTSGKLTVPAFQTVGMSQFSLIR
jgi:anaphase-promoting complex subunit 10